MNRSVREGQSFFDFYLGRGETTVATGEISPYVSLAAWGNGSDSSNPKELGQVATPSAIAEIMAKWATTGKPTLVLDPAAGVGNLLFEVRKITSEARLVGVEHEYATHMKARRAAPAGTTLIHADYLKCKVERADGIIANPPYVKAHHLDYTESDWQFFEESFGLRLDRLTNLYALFLLKIWEDLNVGGRAAVIIPAEFLNANFGCAIKRHLLTTIRPTGIAVFDPSVPVFSSAITTSCILLLHKVCRKDRPVLACKVTDIENARAFVNRLLDDRQKAEVHVTDISSWNPEDKWLNRVFDGETTGLDQLPQRVGDYFRCLRGIATGANNYFTLSPADIKERRMNIDDFVPCITHATDASGIVFTDRDFQRLRKSGKGCYLLNPKDIGPSMKAYLEEGKSTGIPMRHLPSHRPVWYLPENRESAAIWVAVFSREYLKCILNDAGIRNLTCFHGLYSRDAAPGLTEAMTIFINCSYGRIAFKQVNRFYGNGLNKLEPKDVEAMPCPRMPKMTSRDADTLRKKMVEANAAKTEERIQILDSLAGHLFGFK